MNYKNLAFVERLVLKKVLGSITNIFNQQQKQATRFLKFAFTINESFLFIF